MDDVSAGDRTGPPGRLGALLEMTNRRAMRSRARPARLAAAVARTHEPVALLRAARLASPRVAVPALRPADQPLQPTAAPVEPVGAGARPAWWTGLSERFGVSEWGMEQLFGEVPQTGAAAALPPSAATIEPPSTAGSPRTGGVGTQDASAPARRSGGPPRTARILEGAAGSRPAGSAPSAQLRFARTRPSDAGVGGPAADTPRAADPAPEAPRAPDEPLEARDPSPAEAPSPRATPPVEGGSQPASGSAPVTVARVELGRAPPEPARPRPAPQRLTIARPAGDREGSAGGDGEGARAIPEVRQVPPPAAQPAATAGPGSQRAAGADEVAGTRGGVLARALAGLRRRRPDPARAQARRTPAGETGAPIPGPAAARPAAAEAPATRRPAPSTAETNDPRPVVSLASETTPTEIVRAIAPAGSLQRAAPASPPDPNATAQPGPEDGPVRPATSEGAARLPSRATHQSPAPRQRAPTATDTPHPRPVVSLAGETRRARTVGTPGGAPDRTPSAAGGVGRPRGGVIARAIGALRARRGEPAGARAHRVAEGGGAPLSRPAAVIDAPPEPAAPARPSPATPETAQRRPLVSVARPTTGPGRAGPAPATLPTRPLARDLPVRGGGRTGIAPPGTATPPRRPEPMTPVPTPRRPSPRREDAGRSRFAAGPPARAAGTTLARATSTAPEQTGASGSPGAAGTGAAGTGSYKVAGGEDSSSASYVEVLRRVREEREQLGQLITHPF